MKTLALVAFLTLSADAEAPMPEGLAVFCGAQVCIIKKELLQDIVRSRREPCWKHA